MASVAKNRTAPVQLLLKAASSLPLEPIVTGSLLAAVLYAPDQLRSSLPATISGLLSSPKVLTTLKVLLSLGVLRKVSTYLSRRSLNNWTTDPWQTGKEIVLVTGGASGIGAAIVRGLVESSAAVISLDIHEPREPLSAANVFYYTCDVTSSSDLHAVAEKIRATHGAPTILINNAGIHVSKPILEESEEEVRRVFNINTIAHWLTVKEFVPSMVESNHGHVVTIASMASFVAYAGNVDYCCTKAAAWAFSEGLAGELRWLYKAPNVRTTSVHPLWVRTPMVTDALGDKLEKFERAQGLIEPATVAELVVKQLHEGSSGQIVIPEGRGHATGLRGWPHWLQLVVRNGVNSGVARFTESVKRSKKEL